MSFPADDQPFTDYQVSIDDSALLMGSTDFNATRNTVSSASSADLGTKPSSPKRHLAAQAGGHSAASSRRGSETCEDLNRTCHNYSESIIAIFGRATATSPNSYMWPAAPSIATMPVGTSVRVCPPVGAPIDRWIALALECLGSGQCDGVILRHQSDDFAFVEFCLPASEAATEGHPPSAASHHRHHHHRHGRNNHHHAAGSLRRSPPLPEVPPRADVIHPSDGFSSVPPAAGAGRGDFQQPPVIVAPIVTSSASRPPHQHVASEPTVSDDGGGSSAGSSQRQSPSITRSYSEMPAGARQPLRMGVTIHRSMLAPLNYAGGLAEGGGGPPPTLASTLPPSP